MAEIKIPASNGWASFNAKPGDSVLFERGGVFKRNDPATFSPGVTYGAFGDAGKPQPRIDFYNGNFVTVDGTSDPSRAKDITVRDIYFNFNPGKSKYGLHFMSFTNLLLERIRIDGVCGTGLSAERYGNGSRNSGFTLRNSVIENCYPPDNNTHAQGLFLAYSDNWHVVGNVFDRNGYKPGVIGGTQYNQNAYIHGSNGANGEFNSNVSARAAAHGVQLRAGGNAVGNLLYQNACAMSYGLVIGEACFPGGVSGVVKNNVVIAGAPLPGQVVRGWGIQLSNARSVLVDNNLLFGNTVSGGVAMELMDCSGLKVPSDYLDDPKWNLTVRNTYIGNWAGSLLKRSVAGGPGVNVENPRIFPSLDIGKVNVDLDAIKTQVLSGGIPLTPPQYVDDGSGGVLDLSTVLGVDLTSGPLELSTLKAIRLKGKLVPLPQPVVSANPSMQPFFDAAGLRQV